MCVESVDFEVTGSCQDLEGNDGYTRGFRSEIDWHSFSRNYSWPVVWPY